MNAHRDRKGLTLTELLVVIAIVAALLALLVAAVQKSRAAAARAESVNNLRQIGLAVQTYQNRCGVFPSETSPPGKAQAPSFYRSLLPDLDQQALANVTPATAPSVRSFLCTARRGPEVGAKRDFGYASSLALDSRGPSVLDSGPVRLTDITRGAANVYLLTTLWLDPAKYAGGDPTDIGWYAKLNSRMYGGEIFPDSDPAGSDAYLGGPFAGSLPHLFADGHVAEASYAGYTNQWAYQETGTPVASVTQPTTQPAPASDLGPTTQPTSDPGPTSQPAPTTDPAPTAVSAGTPGSTPSQPLMPDSGTPIDGYVFNFIPTPQNLANEDLNTLNNGPDLSDKSIGDKYNALLANPTPDNLSAALNLLKNGSLSAFYYSMNGNTAVYAGDANSLLKSELSHALNNYQTNPGAQSTADLVKVLSGLVPYDNGSGGYVWIDPEIATGYDYTTIGNNFRVVMLPKALACGQKLFELVVNGRTFPLEAGKPFDFTQVWPEGVAAFTIRGIQARENLDPANPTAFVTGVKFMSFAPVRLTMIPKVGHTGLPAWLWFVAAAAVLLAIGGAIIRRRQASGAAVN